MHMDAVHDVLPAHPRHYAQHLIVPARDGRVLELAPDAVCEWCPHWTFPLEQKPRQQNGFVVALTYSEWLVWHWHVIGHQRGVPVS